MADCGFPRMPAFWRPNLNVGGPETNSARRLAVADPQLK